MASGGVYYEDLVVNGEVVSRSLVGALNRYSDSFSRLQVAMPMPLMCLTFQKGLNPEEVEVIGTGSATHVGTGPHMALAVTSGQRVVAQTYRYMMYQPGRSQKLYFTGVLATVPSVDLRSRMGTFDDAADKTPVHVNDRGGDGHFFQLNGTMLAVGQRSTHSSSPYQTDTIVEQAAWNVDKLDGTGPSGVTLDPSKLNIYFIERQWLGAGQVRMGIVMYGVEITAHVWHNENVNDTAFCRTAKLPMRWELDGSAGGAGESRAVCMTMLVTGGNLPRGTPRPVYISPGSGVTLDSTLKPVLSVRLNPAFVRGTSSVESLSIYNPSSTVPVTYVLRRGFVTLTGASWSAVSGDSILEWDSSATAASGGIDVRAGFAVGTYETKWGSRDWEHPMISSSVAGESMIITVLAAVPSGSLADVYFALNLIEYCGSK